MSKDIDNTDLRPMEITAPDLIIDSESDASEDDEPIIFHPKMVTADQSTTKQQDSGIHVNIKEELSNNKISLAKKDENGCQDINFTENSNRNGFNKDRETLIPLTSLDAAEIELDNALLECKAPVEDSYQLVKGDLRDSGESGASLLSKLELKLSEVEKLRENERLILEQAVQKYGDGDFQSVEDANETIKIDLRSELAEALPKVTLNHYVMKRYGRQSVPHCDDVDEDNEYLLHNERSRLKKESETIINNNIKKQQDDEQIRGTEIENVNVLAYKDNAIEKGLIPDSSKLIQSVDSMLENVNRIMYQISDPGEDIPSLLAVNENSTTQDNSIYLNSVEYNDDPEFVTKYTVYDQHTGEESYISPNLYVGRLKSFTSTGEETENHDYEANVQVVHWSDVLAHDRYEAKPCISPVKEMKRENVFDSIFTNSFLSASKTLSDVSHDHNSSNVKLVPSRNILACRNFPKTSSANVRTVEKNFKSMVEPKATKPCDNPIQGEKNSLLDEVRKFKQEVRASMANDDKVKEDASLKLGRQLTFRENTSAATLNLSSGRKDCLRCVADVTTNLETLLKDSKHTCVLKSSDHDVEHCVSVKKTRSTGCSTDDLPTSSNNVSISHELFKPVHNSIYSEIKTQNKKEGFISNADGERSTILQKGSRNKKKKKTKSNKLLLSGVVENNNARVVDVVDELVDGKKTELIQAMEYLSKLDGRKLLFDQDVSFEEPDANLPETNKQLLMLKIPLEMPGICKLSTSDSIHSYVENSVCNTYIGLVTLFVSLLQGSKWNIPAVSHIPFDVVSILQAYLDGELYLIIGIVENQNTYQSKTKRTKLGTNFFHAVSQFLNTTSLETVLDQIWKHTERDNFHKSTPSNIWAQIDQRKSEKCVIPGRGKLSAYVNITPDTQALQRVLALKPAICIDPDSKKIVGTEFLDLDPAVIQQDWTCITVTNILSLSPKHMSVFLKRLQTESVELCGLKLVYVSESNDLQPVLAVGIKEVYAAMIEEGKSLLSHCEELKELAISFHSSTKISSVQKHCPLINYVINKTYSHKEVVRFFGPHYSPPEFDEVTHTLKSVSSKFENQSNKHRQKKKWNVDDNLRQFQLFTCFPSYSILLMSSAVPSMFISIIIALASKKSLQLRTLNKNVVNANQLGNLGIPESQTKIFGYSQANLEKPSSSSGIMNNFTSMLFYGSSATVRLLGLVEKLTYILNTSLTGESLQSLIKDNSFTFPPSHNTEILTATELLTRSCSDYFVVLNFNQTTKDLFSTTPKVPSQSLIEDVYPAIADARLAYVKPELNLMALVFYGSEMVNKVPQCLNRIFGDVIYDGLANWRRFKLSNSCTSDYTPSIELLGMKCLKELTKHQALHVSQAEVLKHRNSYTDFLTGKDAGIVLLRIADHRCSVKLEENLSKYILSSKVDVAVSSVIVHTDVDYICRLMFQFFHPNEIHADNIRDRTQVSPVILPEKHHIFRTIDKIYGLQLLTNVAIKKSLPISNNITVKDSVVFQLNPLTLSFPLQLLLLSEKSYAALSIKYSPGSMFSIAKLLARISRMGFQIVGLKFPVFLENAIYLHVILKREDAIIVLTKLQYELQRNFQLKFQITETHQEVLDFIRSGAATDGAFFPDNAAHALEISFETDIVYDGKDNREIVWHSSLKSNEYDFKMAQPSRVNVVDACHLTEEVTVVLIPHPLLCGCYMNKRLPMECTFAEIWQMFETISYRTLAAKMTSLCEKAANEIAEVFSPKKTLKIVRILSGVHGPFVAVVIVGSCVLSDFWMHMDRKIGNESVRIELKKHLIVPSTRMQVETLLRSLFDKVLSNPKFDLINRVW